MSQIQPHKKMKKQIIAITTILITTPLANAKKLDIENSSLYTKVHYANEVNNKNELFISEKGLGIGYEKNFVLGADNIKHNVSLSAELIPYHYHGGKLIGTKNNIRGFGEYGSLKTAAAHVNLAAEYIASIPSNHKSFRFLLGGGVSEKFNGVNARFNTKLSGIVGLKLKTDDDSDITFTYERSLLNKFNYRDARGTLSRPENTFSLSRNDKKFGITLSYTLGPKGEYSHGFYEPEYKELSLKINFFF